MKLKLFLVLFLGVSVILQSCKKDDDSAYLRKDEIFKKEGVFNIAITGQSPNGYELNELAKFEYTGRSNTYTELDSILSFIINEGDMNFDGSNIELMIHYNKYSKVAKILNCYLTYKKEIDSKNLLLITENFYAMNSESPNYVISNFSFDSNTNVVKGNISLSKSFINTNPVYTMVVIGDFIVNVKKIVNENMGVYYK